MRLVGEALSSREKVELLGLPLCLRNTLHKAMTNWAEDHPAICVRIPYIDSDAVGSREGLGVILQ